ncbi:hypothetical protein TNCV_4851031 [Trichonephila clavipes]|nr:hypothetical protein TNCV_4851031 [Trichonephila clavipes]
MGLDQATQIGPVGHRLSITVVNGLARDWPIKNLHMLAAFIFMQFLLESNKISVPFGDMSPYVSGRKETILVLLCLGRAVGEMKLLLLGFVVDIIELNGMWWILKFTLLVGIAM